MEESNKTTTSKDIAQDAVIRLSEGKSTINQVRAEFGLEPIEGGSQFLSEEKLQWMKEVGINKFDKPMKYHAPYGMLYSEEYIASTPLDELKKKFAESQRCLQEPIDPFEEI